MAVGHLVDARCRLARLAERRTVLVVHRSPSDVIFEQSESIVETTVSSVLRHGTSVLIVLANGRTITVAFGHAALPADLHLVALDHVVEVCDRWARTGAIIELATAHSICALRDPSGLTLPLPASRP